MPVITLPTNLDFERWADQLRIDLSLMSIPIHTGIDNWRDWANQIANSNDTVIPIATEIGYPNNEDWRNWAVRFYEIMQSIPNK